jgi:O-antigen/teichoic acid export membrane protein
MYMTGQMGRPHISSLLTWLSVPVTIGLLFLLVPRYGYAGAAAAMAATYAFLFVLFLTAFVRLTGLSNPADYLVPKREDFRSFAKYFEDFFKGRR